ncbi:MAG TPA: hypothetical protein VJ765_02350 [Chitinophagaceae bacterium]|nr:hypothetical protein [Chitinophagaceae bacterium]
MALTEYNGKVYGYAYSTFIINDTLYYIVKRVKGKVQGDICEVEDDEVISHNFPQKPEKKVFVTYTLRRNISDSVWKLDGNWKTNLTKKYYSISGNVETKEEKDLSKSKLYEHLGDLDLQKTLAFNKPKEKTPEKKPVQDNENKNDIAKNTVKKEQKKDIQQPNTKPVDKKPEATVAKTETKAPDAKTPTTTINNQSSQTEKKDVTLINSSPVNKNSEFSTAKTETKLPDTKTTTTNTNNKSNQPEKKDVAVTNADKPENKQPDNKIVSVPVNTPPNQIEKKDIAATSISSVDKKSETNITKPENAQPGNKTASVPASNQTNTKTDSKQQPDTKLVSVPVGYKPTQIVNDYGTNPNTADKKPDASVAKTESKPADTKVSSSNNQNEKKVVVASEPNADNEFEFQELKRTNRRLKPAASLVDGRVSIPSETIYFKSDSLSIALYDNGEVDGDSVSVIINDEMFIEKQILKSSAYRKTFYVPQGESDSLLVVLYAENLGKYPPNTGLLQIKDGEEIFYVRFKADLDRNAAIVLRRKYK